jgi:hypothetical protein
MLQHMGNSALSAYYTWQVCVMPPIIPSSILDCSPRHITLPCAHITPCVLLHTGATCL